MNHHGITIMIDYCRYQPIINRESPGYNHHGWHVVINQLTIVNRHGITIMVLMSAFQTNCKIQTHKQWKGTLIWYNYCNLNILGHANILPDTPGTEHPNHTEPNKYNVFIYHLLTIVLSLWKRGLPPKFANVLYCHVKLVFFSPVYVFGFMG